MPTIQDIANQVNNTLTQINLNTQDTANTLALIKGDTADLNSRVDNLAVGMFAMLEQLRRANSLLEGQVRQNDAQLCWLRSVVDVLCRVLHRQNSQLELQAEIADDMDKVRKLLEVVHAAESAEVDRLEALEAKLRECCPSPVEPPEMCPTPCPSPVVEPYRARDNHDWNAPRPHPAQTGGLR